jgi:DNA-binding NtrC family response regulator
MHKAKKKLLIVDDDRNFCLSVRDYLNESDIDVHISHTGEDCLGFCSEHSVDVVLLDQKLPDAEGSDLCPAILDRNSQAKIIFTTAFPSFDNAVKAVRNGAFDYLSKPIELRELDLALKQALRTLDLEKVEQFQNYRCDLESEKNVLVGNSSLMDEIRRIIGLASNADAPVLVTGETGSGKNAAARAIHYGGPLRHAAFVSINCAALPENLVEEELYGHEKGAFTGASTMKRGMFEMAGGGTLLLDEIGEMPMGLQTKLLGVLDDGFFRRIGGTSTIKAQARIIAATSIDIEKAIQKKKFREDLFYRLGVIKINLPPLRDRKEDLPELADFLLRKVAKGRRVSLGEAEKEKLMHYDWPGNVRELRNVLERAAILQHSSELRPSELLAPAATGTVRVPQPHKKAAESPNVHSLDAIEKKHILAAIQEHGGNYSRAARAIGISLSTLKRRLKQYKTE